MHCANCLTATRLMLLVHGRITASAQSLYAKPCKMETAHRHQPRQQQQVQQQRTALLSPGNQGGSTSSRSRSRSSRRATLTCWMARCGLKLGRTSLASSAAVPPCPVLPWLQLRSGKHSEAR